MLLRNLTEEEKEDFTEAFYELENAPEDLESSPWPWGCPWEFNPSLEVQGNTIEELAQAYYESVEQELLAIESEEEEEEEQERLGAAEALAEAQGL